MLKGANFAESKFGKARCVFNGTYWTNATIQDSQTLFCTTPAWGEGVDDELEHMFYHVSVSLDGENFS